MEIKLTDLFYGFVRNYDIFRISRESGGTDYTHRVLWYFYQLGQLLGFTVKYEKKRYDLGWYKESEKEPFFHVEHENVGSWEKLRETIDKLHYSVCENIVGIVYPRNQELWERFVNTIKQKQKGWTVDSISLFILDPYYMKDREIMEGHILSSEGHISLKATIKENTDTGLLYAIPYMEEIEQ